MEKINEEQHLEKIWFEEAAEQTIETLPQFIKRFESTIAAARSVGVWNVTITQVCNGKLKQCKGYRWKWANDEPVELKEE